MKEKEIITKQQRRQMKQKLFRWGKTMEYCNEKQQGIEKLQKMLNQFLSLEKSAPFLGQADISIKEAKKLYESEIIKMTECMKNEMIEYSKMQRYIEKLDYQEQIFLKLRYQKCCGYEWIALQTHKSRATCFREQELILDKLILLEKNNTEQKEAV